MKKKTLLFYFGDEQCSASASVIPTLSSMCKKLNIDFETYICTRNESWGGKVLPFIGHNHAESFYYLANFYEKIVYCSITKCASYQFKREVMAFGGDIICCCSDDEILEFYEKVHSYFKIPLPNTVIAIPEKPKDGDKWIAPYCYPDILFSDSLGVSEEVVNKHDDMLMTLGVRQVYELYCKTKTNLLKTTCIDVMNANDTYADITTRIVERNINHAKGIGYADPSCLFRWQAVYCREDILTLYQDYDWEDFLPKVAEYAKAVNNFVILGNQRVFSKKINEITGEDDVITEFSKNGVIMNLIGVDPRIGFTIQKQKKLPLDWLNNAPSVWDDEYDDNYLLQKARDKAIPVCFLFYAADLGHLPVITRFLDLMGLDGMRAGIAFPSTWYEYHPELLEQLYIPLAQGGVFPQLEPLISSCGVAVAPEAEGFIAPEFLTQLLLQAKHEIAEHVGQHMVPKGYYPFQDANPYYNSNTAKPQYDAVAEAGFEYYITYKDGGTNAAIKYEGKGMTVLNQQIEAWFPGAGHPTSVLKEWENTYCSQNNSGWISFGFDTPFFGLAPTYLGGVENELMRATWLKHGGMTPIYEAMQYVRRGGGNSGKLFMLKPHELYRYAKILQKENMLK